MAAATDLKALQGFLDETNDSLRDIEGAFIRLEEDPSNQEIINEIFRPVHSMKGNSGFFGLTNINHFAHRLENLLDFIRTGQLTATKAVIDILLAGIDMLQQMLVRVAADPEDVALRPEEEQFLRERVDAISPEKAAGSYQSLLELEKLLEQAAEMGPAFQQHSLIRKILDRAERDARDLKKLLAEQKGGLRCRYSPLAVYSFQGQEVTATLKPVGQALACLDGGSPVDRPLLAGLTGALQELAAIFQGEFGLAAAFDELIAMAGFLDDPLMVASHEFGETIRRHVNAILSQCEARDPEDPEESRLGEILLRQGKITRKQLDRALACQARLGEILIVEGLVSKTDIEQALALQDRQQIRRQAREKQSASKSIRIDQDKLDQFADSVGDLFINVDAFNFLGRQLEQQERGGDLLNRFTNTVASLDEKVSRLQENIMDIRKVSIKSLFQRFPRVVRTLADSLGKSVKLEIRGEDTVIDKDLLEKIENPLVHLLRNAVDHGIESPEVRRGGGKGEEGSLILKAAADDTSVIITIADDGGGIDPARTRKTAVAKGFMTQEEADRLTDRELINLIFRPGFSSAERVSDVSGRGVGMDVVHSAVRECKGTIDVDSAVGRGTTVTLKVPLTRTLVTKEALIVGCGEQLFAIPSEEIESTLYPDDFMSLLSRGRGFAHEGILHTVISLTEFFDLPPAADSSEYPQGVLVIWNRERIAFLVERMYSHQKIVVRSFPACYQQFRAVPGISGYTILGNEEIVLIVDPADVAVKTISAEAA